MTKMTNWYVVAGENYGVVEDADGRYLIDDEDTRLAAVDDRGLAIGAVAIDIHRTIYTITGTPPHGLLPRIEPMVGSLKKPTA